MEPLVVFLLGYGIACVWYIFTRPKTKERIHKLFHKKKPEFIKPYPLVLPAQELMEQVNTINRNIEEIIDYPPFDIPMNVAEYLAQQEEVKRLTIDILNQPWFDTRTMRDLGITGYVQQPIMVGEDIFIPIRETRRERRNKPAFKNKRGFEFYKLRKKL